MSILRPFRAVRPAEDLASSIAALPYDVYTSEEARRAVGEAPLSFLRIDRAETQFPEGTDIYSDQVYEKARDILNEMISDGSFIQENSPCYYIYSLTMDGRTQSGVVGCASVDDYLNGVILKHEKTLEEKELDRIRHVDTCSAQTGPIFLTFRPQTELEKILHRIRKGRTLYDFVSEDGIRHQVWRIDRAADIENISHIFSKIPHLYIADGHHRAASAVKVGMRRRAADPGFSGTEEYNFFLSVLFPSDELKIYDYNRVVSDRNGYTFDELLDMIENRFEVTRIGEEPFHPSRKGEFGMYCEGTWYRLRTDAAYDGGDPVRSLDVSLLQELILEPLLGIHDPRTDSRISFIGGIRGLRELTERADASGGIAFSMYPTSMEELLRVADAGMLMPPKSTWFEPKLRSGLFIHRF